MNPVPGNDRLKELANKWMEGRLTPEEKALLEAWYETGDPGQLLWSGQETEAELQERIFSQLKEKIKEDENLPVYNHRYRNTRTWWAAAAVFLFAVAGYFFYHRNNDDVQPQALAVNTPKRLNTAVYTRYLTLPDGSIVVLHANSHLNYPQQFTGKTREVTLVGEAYFDVRHDKKKPFIIHAGGVKTTVLGTAFNISAYPGAKKVVVSVTRGRVKVENEKKLVTVLVPNQQVACSAETAEVAKAVVNAASLVTDWTKQDMIFEETSFDQTAQVLSRRYGVDIRFRKDRLKNCRIKAFFNGTESLEKVLEVLCIIGNASYSKTDAQTIFLDGDGCGG